MTPARSDGSGCDRQRSSPRLQDGSIVGGKTSRKENVRQRPWFWRASRIDRRWGNPAFPIRCRRASFDETGKIFSKACVVAAQNFLSATHAGSIAKAQPLEFSAILCYTTIARRRRAGTSVVQQAGVVAAKGGGRDGAVVRPQARSAASQSGPSIARNPHDERPHDERWLPRTAVTVSNGRTVGVFP